MIRTQIQLTEQQVRAIKAVASREGVSMAEVIRQAVDRIVAERDRQERRRRAMAVLGRFCGDPADVSVRHDAYLADDFQ